MPPGLCEKGVGAEADALAGIFAGNSENIRLAVAFFAKGYHLRCILRLWGVVVFAAIFF